MGSGHGLPMHSGGDGVAPRWQASPWTDRPLKLVRQLMAMDSGRSRPNGPRYQWWHATKVKLRRRRPRVRSVTRLRFNLRMHGRRGAILIGWPRSSPLTAAHSACSSRGCARQARQADRIQTAAVQIPGDERGVAGFLLSRLVSGRQAMGRRCPTFKLHGGPARVTAGQRRQQGAH